MRIPPTRRKKPCWTKVISLFPHQELVIPKLKTGSVLCGGVGSGKSIAALAYYYRVECGGSDSTPMTRPKNLYIITTAMKRDRLEWEKDCAHFGLSKDSESSESGVTLVVDSWNKIKKYVDVKNSYFIFDEQRVVGSGAWVKAFLKITKNNPWILLSATPGDTWLDYIPAFVANGFYKNRTQFLREHVVYNTFTKYPKVDRYIETGRLIKYKNQILVKMPYKKPTIPHDIQVTVDYDKEKFSLVKDKRWNPYKECPVKDVGDWIYTLRKVVNSDPSRLNYIKDLLSKHSKIIVFYSFDYELDILRKLREDLDIPITEYNGHYHEEIPQTDSWIHLVNYSSGAEGWNCVETDAMVFYSQHYSFRVRTQSSGRIDRLNTEFIDLYYYYLYSNSWIDSMIMKSVRIKKDFNELDPEVFKEFKNS